jgi:hypothetical protein
VPGANRRPIAQLASVAQGIVSTSVKLEQIKVERQGKREKADVQAVVEKIRAAMAAAGQLKDDVRRRLDCRAAVGNCGGVVWVGSAA